MLTKDQIKTAAVKALQKAAVETPEDVKIAFRQAAKVAQEPAKTHLEKTLENISAAVERNVPVCPDTGWPLFFVKLGHNISVENGYSTITSALSAAVEQLTQQGFLRITMVDPITRETVLTNVGSNIPFIEYKFTEKDYIELTFVPKGGGAELFLTTPFRMVLLADGLEGVKKFVLDSVIDAATSGKTCPPNVIGVGMGGFPDLCMKLAKQAGEQIKDKGDRDYFFEDLNAGKWFV